MTLEELVAKYISSAEGAFSSMVFPDRAVNMDFRRVGEIVESARDYLKDAKYYREKKKLEVSLTSIAYCEGLLDALRLLGVVSFEWPRKVKRAKKAK